MNYLRSLTRAQITVFMVSVLVLFGVLTWWFNGNPANASPSLQFSTDINNLATVAGRTVYKVTRGEITQTLTFEGRVEASKAKNLFFEVGGIISKIDVKNGTTVEEGTLIGELDTEDLEFERDRALYESQLAEYHLKRAKDAGQSDIERAQLQFDITKLRLNPGNSITDTQKSEREARNKELQVAQLTLDEAKQRMRTGNYYYSEEEARYLFYQAELALNRAERRLSKAQIKAPSSGTVRFSEGFEVGMPVQPFEPMAILVDPNQLAIQSNIAKSDMQFLYEGMDVTLEVKSRPGNQMKGSIETLPQPFGNGINTLTSIKFEPSSNSRIQVREGMAFNVTIELEHKKDVLWLPADAISKNDEKAFVYILENWQMKDVPVEIGIESETRVEIIDGLKEGQEVVTP